MFVLDTKSKVSRTSIFGQTCEFQLQPPASKLFFLPINTVICTRPYNTLHFYTNTYHLTYHADLPCHYNCQPPVKQLLKRTVFCLSFQIITLVKWFGLESLLLNRYKTLFSHFSLVEQSMLGWSSILLDR